MDKVNFPPEPWFDPKTGNPTLGFRRFLEDQINNPYLGGGNIGENISGTALAKAEAKAAQASADAATSNADQAAGASGAFSASVSPSTVTKQGSGSQTTASVTVTPANGTGPYTYAWTRAPGSALIDADSPSSNITTFTGFVPPTEPISAVFKCLVTDTSDSSTYTVSVSVTFSAASGFETTL